MTIKTSSVAPTASHSTRFLPAPKSFILGRGGGLSRWSSTLYLLSGSLQVLLLLLDLDLQLADEAFLFSHLLLQGAVGLLESVQCLALLRSLEGNTTA